MFFHLKGLLVSVETFYERDQSTLGFRAGEGCPVAAIQAGSLVCTPFNDLTWVKLKWDFVFFLLSLYSLSVLKKHLRFLFLIQSWKRYV